MKTKKKIVSFLFPFFYNQEGSWWLKGNLHKTLNAASDIQLHWIPSNYRTFNSICSLMMQVPTCRLGGLNFYLFQHLCFSNHGTKVGTKANDCACFLAM